MARAGTLVVETQEGLAVIQAEDAVLLDLKTALPAALPGTPAMAALGAFLEQKGLTGGAVFYTRQPPSTGDTHPDLSHETTLGELERRGLLPVLRTGLDSHGYFDRLRTLGFTPLFRGAPPDELSRRLPQDVCLRSESFTSGDGASLRVGSRELFRPLLPTGLMIATLAPGAKDWSFNAFDTFSAGPATQFAAFLKTLPPDTLVLWAVKGVAHRYLLGDAYAGMRALGSRLRPDQVGSDQHRFSHAFMGVVGRPELAREAIHGDEPVRLCHHGGASYAATPQHALPLPVLVLENLKDDSPAWFLESDKAWSAYRSASP